MIAPAPFTCTVTAAGDGDTITVEANELRGGCHIAVCPAMPARQAQRVVSRLTLHQRLTCQPVGRSYQRVVARCTFVGSIGKPIDLSCAAIAAGAAVRWPAYWTRYRMGECR